MKPKINRVVYTIYEDAISKDIVGFLGKDSFIVKDFVCERDFYSLEYFYEDYNETWFISLTQAKLYLLQKGKEENPNNKVKIIEINPNYWELYLWR